jgi:hypothetical protein
MTLSARTNTFGGTVKPICLAALRLGLFEPYPTLFDEKLLGLKNIGAALSKNKLPPNVFIGGQSPPLVWIPA